MKQFVCLVAALCLEVSLFAQAGELSITTGKTTSLVFPFPILHVDRGSKNILVQPVRGAEHILLLKALCENFPETNLSVVTRDGSVYSFAVCYGETPVWVYHVPVQAKTSVATYANSLLDNPKTMRDAGDGCRDMKAGVTGIYIKDDVLYCQLRFQNQSPIDYEVNYVRFYLRDKKKSKRTAVQETELMPLYTAGNASRVRANNRNIIVVALERFTIPDGKYLLLEIGEKNGGRNLTIKLGNRVLNKAIPLPDFK